MNNSIIDFNNQNNIILGSNVAYFNGGTDDIHAFSDGRDRRSASTNVLELIDLQIEFRAADDKPRFVAVTDINLRVGKGEFVALVGESGAGKSLIAKSCMGLLPSSAVLSSGQIKIKGQRVENFSSREWQKYRSSEIAIVFQDASSALNPVLTVGSQVLESLHQCDLSFKSKQELVYQMLAKVQLDDVYNIYQAYPHQLSGGMCQRVMIALALINNPKILIADEPTSALDVALQKQIIDLLKTMNKELDTAILLISHDLNLVASVSERVYLLKSGQIIESGLTNQVLHYPATDYAKSLLAAKPSFAKRGERLGCSLTGGLTNDTSRLI